MRGPSQEDLTHWGVRFIYRKKQVISHLYTKYTLSWGLKRLQIVGMVGKCLVDFLALTELLGTVHKISIGLRSGFWAGHSKSLMLATACIPKPVLIYL